MTDLQERANPDPAPAVTASGRVTPAAPIGSDVGSAVVALLFCTTGIWSLAGGVDALLGGWSAFWGSIASLTGLLASTAGLVGLLLVARPRSLERRYGLDRLFDTHRILGEAMAVLLALHVAASLVAWSLGGGFGAALSDLTGGLPYMAAATVGSALVGVVTVSSLKVTRRHFSYESWYFVHLLAYVGFALAVPHTVTLGSSLAARVALWYWIGLHALVAVALLVGRFRSTVLSLLRPLRVRSVAAVGPDAAAIELCGDRLERLRCDAGQFFLLRPLTAGLWWQTHPFSLSAAPTGDRLRFTVKHRGDASRAITELAPGTRVAVEGPYGAITAEKADGRRAVFIAGGVGVAPVVAMLERMTSDSAPVVLIRARSEEDLLHLGEVTALAAARGGCVRTLVGRTAMLALHDPFAAEHLRALVPDIDERSAFLFGPDSLLVAARSGLRAAGVPDRRIHLDRAW